MMPTHLCVGKYTGVSEWLSRLNRYVGLKPGKLMELADDEDEQKEKPTCAKTAWEGPLSRCKTCAVEREKLLRNE